MKKDRRSIVWILAILFCIYKNKLLEIRFSSHTIRSSKSTPQSHLALRKYSSTKSHLLCYSKAMPFGLSVATIYGNVQNFVWLPWQPFKSRTLISWRLFVTTTRRNTELLVHNHYQSIPESLCCAVHVVVCYTNTLDPRYIAVPYNKIPHTIY